MNMQIMESYLITIRSIKVSIYRSLLVFSLLTLLTGCAKQQMEASYYLLEFAPTAINPRLMVDEPLPYRVQVLNFKIPRSYDSNRIIARLSSHQINYYRYSLWAVKPQVAVADLLVQQVNAYHLFKDCQREFLDERPDYEITGELAQIERYESPAYVAAHLRMEFDLYDFNDKDILVTHAFDREIPVPAANMTIFAKALSDLVAEESEIFLIKVNEYLRAREDSAGVGQ
jgi:ABC-type uncharacterized transport system auxiliary subunit